MRTFTLAALSFLLSGGPAAAAINGGAGSSGGAFLKLAQGATRAMGLGRAYVALAEGADALTWNPAGLALAQQREAVYSYLRYVQDVDSPLYAAYAHPLGRTVWGANIAYLTVSGFDVRDSAGRPNQDTGAQVRDGFGTLAVARSFWFEKIFLGGGLRLIHEDIAGNLNDSVVGDVGAIWKPNQSLSLGFSFQNLGASVQDAARVARQGAALRIGEFVTASLEVTEASDNSPRVGLGGEFTLPEEYLEFGSVVLRLGYYTSDNLGQSFNGTLKNFHLDRTNGFAFGLGITTSRAFGYTLGVDYAVVPSGALGTIDQISLKVRF